MLNHWIPNIIRDDLSIQKNYFISLWLTVLLASFAVGVTIYSYSIFLSYYPISWIPYWMLSESALIFLIGSILSTFNIQNLRKYAQNILLTTSLLIVISLSLINLDWYWGPFIAVLILRACSNTVGVGIWGLLPTLFYFRQFKTIMNRFTISATLGAILAPILFAVITIYFDMSLLLILFVAALIFGSFSLSQTQSVNVSKPNISFRTKQKTNSFQYPLFTNIILISLILSILYGGSEFLFRAQLGLNFTQEQIAIFMSFFMSIANLISLITQFFTPQLFARVKFYVVLQFVFLLITCSAIYYWISPSVWPAVILASTKIIFDNGWLAIIRRNVVNIFPPLLMNRNELYVKTYIAATGGIIAALLALFSTHVTLFLNYFPLILILLSILGIFLSSKLFKQYLSTLKEMVVIAGFSNATSTNKDLGQLKLLVQEKLKKPNVSSLEVSLVTPKLFKLPPDSLYDLLKLKINQEIKTTILNIFKLYPGNKLDYDKLAEVYENKELLSDANRETILNLLSDLHSQGMIEKAKKRLEEEPLSKNSLLILLKHGDTDDYLFALERTLELAKASNYMERLLAAKLIYTLGAGRFYDLKNRLLTDEESIVRITAFNSLPAKDVQYMLPSLGKFLNRNVIKILHNRFSLNELNTLAKSLMELYEKNTAEYSLSAILFITPIPSHIIEEYVIDFLKTNNTFYRTNLATALLNRKKKITFSTNLQDELFKAMNFELDLIREYRKVYYHPRLKNAQIMIRNRINHAKRRFLLWYAVWHQDTLNIYSTISNMDLLSLKENPNNALDKKIEYLISNESQLIIRNMLEKIFDKTPPSKLTTLRKDFPIKFANDEWLTNMLNDYDIEGNDMNPLQRAIVLQKTEFFESLPEEVLFELGQSCKLMDYAKDEVIIKEGEEGDCLYILIQGELWVYKNQNLLATISPIECLGEMALFGNTKRTTTIIAKERAILLALTKDDFMTLTSEFPQILQNVIEVIIKRFSDQVNILEGKTSET